MQDINIIRGAKDFNADPFTATPIDITSGTQTGSLTSSPIRQVTIKLKATSPASWSTGRYWLGIRLTFDNTGIGGQLIVPLVWNQSETSVTKEAFVTVPVLRSTVGSVEFTMEPGRSGYNFTGVDGIVYADIGG